MQAGLRTDYLFRLANQHDALVMGTGDLSELALGWCTYGVGDQMSHYNVNAGVPKTLIQHLIRWVVERGQFAPDVGATLTGILATEISPELVPVAAGEPPQSTEAASAPTSCRTSTCSTRCATASAPRASPSWPCTPGATGSAAPGRPASPTTGGARTTCPRSAAGWSCSCAASSASASSSARPCRTAPRSSAGGSLSPRGDWRAPSDGTAAAWLEELERAVPKE